MSEKITDVDRIGGRKKVGASEREIEREKKRY